MLLYNHKLQIKILKEGNIDKNGIKISKKDKINNNKENSDTRDLETFFGNGLALSRI
jgi:hypothetical protein